MKKMKKKRAFSLVEILISLIVISCVLAAFVPVITKKMTKNIEIKAISGDGESGDNVVNNSAIAINGQTQTIAITDKIKNFKILTLQAAGGGGGGALLYGAPPRSQADCPEYTMFVTAEYNGNGDGTGGKNTCVTQYNVGDAPGFDDSFFDDLGYFVYDGVRYGTNSTAPAGYSYSYAIFKYTGTQNGANGDSTYNSKRRFVYWGSLTADKKLVNNYQTNYTRKTFWRKPYRSEFSAWVENITTLSAGKGKDGLQLCAYCRSGTPTDSFCCPEEFDADLWNSSHGHCSIAGTLINENDMPNSNYSKYYMYMRYYSSNTPPYTALGYEGNCGSLRLVTSKVFHDGSRYGGAGGSSGANVLNITIPQDVIDAYPNGFITIYAGKSGKAGMSAVDFDTPTNGEKGEDSYILLTDASLNPKWGIMVIGGEGGKAATSSGHAISTARASMNCKKLDSTTGYRWTTVLCSSLGAESAFEGLAGGITTTTEEGGYGGAVNTPYDGGVGGNTSNCIGQGGVGHGTGGGGAYLDLSYAFAFDDAKTVCTAGTGGTGYVVTKWGEEQEETEEETE